MEYDLKCVICGKPFKGRSPRAKCCSEICRNLQSKMIRRSWETKTDYQARKQAARKNRSHTEPTKKPRENPIQIRSASMERNLRSCEYWDRWKADQIREAETFGRKVGGYVNGIPVDDPEFALKVSITIEELNHIHYEYYRGEPI